MKDKIKIMKIPRVSKSQNTSKIVKSSLVITLILSRQMEEMMILEVLVIFSEELEINKRKEEMILSALF